jgi:two-component system OmpR family response regulator
MLSVLYVDDDPDIRIIAEMSLSLDPAMTVSLAESGPEALARVRELPPDVVLLDVMMPGMDGCDTLNALRAQGTAPPVIFVTARTQSFDVAYLKSIGSIGVIGKPFDPMSLASTVRRLLVESTQH